MPEAFASIAVGRPVRGLFTYAVPSGLRYPLREGQRVVVPFGRGKALGFYLGAAQRPDAEALAKVKPLLQQLEDEPTLTPDVLAVLRFAAEHYRYPLGEALRTALPPGLSTPAPDRTAEPLSEAFAVAEPGADPAALRRAPAQSASLSYVLAVGGRAAVAEVAHAIPGARDALKRLVERGLVRIEREAIVPAARSELTSTRPRALTPDQASALATVEAALDERTFAPFLLHGVTGSGKTEVYLRAVEHALSAGRGSLVLVPEIALTPQLVGRFRGRFGAQVAVLHSALSDRERLLAWQKLRSGQVPIAVGVRSAVFAPVLNLGLVVVDEEHDGSFKQDEKLRYHARDLAVVRARDAGGVVLLGSATPSLETLENARRGRYRHLTLRTRVDDRPLPEVRLVDLREERPRFAHPPAEPPILGDAVLTAMEEVLARGQQVILFLNRRGFSTYLLCSTCGQAVRCGQCDVSLTHHLKSKRLLCHYCGEHRPVPPACPECQGPLLELGVGTERVEAEVAARFRQARVARLDRDMVTSAERLTEMLAAFARREVDVLVGTQMVAKGHDFPGVTLVCVVLADTGLHLPDFRAAERTFQVLTQVAGRAGRGADRGRVLIQTYNPEAEPVSRVVGHDFDGFADRELAWRREQSYPPFARLVAIRLEGDDAHRVEQTALRLGHRLEQLLPPAHFGVRLLGPARAPIERLRGKTRWQLLLKAPTHAVLAPLLQQLERDVEKLPHAVKVVIDVDPGTML